MKRALKIQAFVTVRDRHGRVKARGKSKPGNLILDNFGKWLAAFISAVDTAAKTVSLTDVGNAARTLNIYESATLFCETDTRSIGTRLQVGSGTTAAARGDYAIETAFATSPENGRFSTAEGSYAAGAISLSGAITAGGSGTVNETGLFGVWTDSGGTAREIMLFHDIISPGVAFVASDIITVSYSIRL